MPSILTHYIFLKENEKEINPIANIGTQGPDPFFFNMICFDFSKRNQKVTTVGHFLHNIDPIITFDYCIKYIKEANKEEKPILIDYFKGMMAHYALDSVAHPYIFYKSGFVTDDPSKKGEYFLSHASIEAHIDALLKDHFKLKETPAQTVKYNKKDLMIVSKMIYNYLRDEWDMDYVLEDSFYKAVHRMKVTYKIDYSHHGARKWFYKHALKNTIVNVLSTPRLKDIPPLDFLNLKHNLFVDCCTGRNPKTADFYELMDEASIKYQKMRLIFEGILEDRYTIDELAKITNSIDHDGKIAGSEMKHFKLIWAELDTLEK